MNGIHPELLKQLKEYYKPGTKVILGRMNDPYVTIPPGTIGEVLCVDDLGTAHVIWNNGITLGLAFGADEYRKVEEDEHE